jgi:hypothetical protein
MMTRSGDSVWKLPLHNNSFRNPSYGRGKKTNEGKP